MDHYPRAGYGLTDGRFLPCSGVSGRNTSSSPCSSRGPYKTLTHLKTAPVKCTTSRMSIVCNFSRENKHGFPRNRNNRKDDENGFESLDESDDILSSKNGTISSASNPPRYQPTSTSKPKQNEILELFKKIQIQVRERDAAKGDRKKKTELNQPHGKDDEPVENILKILRENRSKTGKTGRSSSGSNRGIILEEAESNRALEKEKSTLDSILDHSILNQSEQNGTFERKESSTSSNSRNNLKDKAQGHGRESPTFRRPVSKFQRRSPVPQVKDQLVPSDSVTDTWVNGKSEMLHPDPETNDSGIEMEPDPGFSEGIVFDGMLEEEDSEILEGYGDVELEEDKPMIDEDLSGMKLPELRALAKSRGVKGISKLKKLELVELLSAGDST